MGAQNLWLPIDFDSRPYNSVTDYHATLWPVQSQCRQQASSSSSCYYYNYYGWPGDAMVGGGGNGRALGGGSSRRGLSRSLEVLADDDGWWMPLSLLPPRGGCCVSANIGLNSAPHMYNSSISIILYYTLVLAAPEVVVVVAVVTTFPWFSTKLQLHVIQASLTINWLPNARIQRSNNKKCATITPTYY